MSKDNVTKNNNTDTQKKQQLPPVKPPRPIVLREGFTWNTKGSSEQEQLSQEQLSKLILNNCSEDVKKALEKIGIFIDGKTNMLEVLDEVAKVWNKL